MQVIEKTQLLKAMKKILREYKKGTHNANVDICALCKLYNRGDYVGHKGHQCRLCPMHVFYKRGNHPYSCMSRKCTPFDTDDYNKTDVEFKRVTKFYSKAIKVVETMSEEQLNAENAFKFFIKIDKDVFEKYWE
jgi:hypothetical protein